MYWTEKGDSVARPSFTNRSLTCTAVLAGLVTSVAIGVLNQAVAQQSTAQTPAVVTNIASYLPGGANVDPDVTRVNAEIDAREASALAQLASPPTDPYSRTVLIGNLVLFDKTLSVGKNLACTTCHDPMTGFTGASSFFKPTI